MMFVGQNPKSVILLTRKPKVRNYTLICFGRKSHYRVDGSCRHVEEILANVKPELKGRVKVDGWGGKPPAKKS